jgi:hypothetical protein
MTVFLPIVPNWQNGVRDTYEFKTKVFTTRDGSEQRRSHRIQPRRSIDVAVLLDDERLRNFSDAINMAKDGKVQIADFSGDRAILQETVSNGATVLKVDQIPPWLVDGSTCTLLSGRVAQKINVDFVSGNQVALNSGVVGAVGQGAQLLPMLPASLGTSTTLSIYTTLVATSSLSFDVEPGTIVRVADDLPFDDSADGETTQVFGPAALFYGRYALLRKPNYLQQPQTVFLIPFQSVDYDRGIRKVFAPVPIIRRTLTATYLALSRADAIAILDVFVRCLGMAGEIYVPTWGHDLPKVLSVTTDTITVEGTNFYDAYNGDKAHKTILIRAKDGTLVPREIDTLLTSGGNTLITCDADIGLSADQIDHISWMFVARFAQDVLTIDWQTDGKANISLSFTTLANLSAEDNFGNNWILATGYWRDGGIWQDDSAWQD